MISRLARTLLVFLATAAFSSDAAAGPRTLVITRGGTYGGGSYEQITVNTREPVVIENATLRGSGHLITSHYQHANLTVRNTRGVGVPPVAAGQGVGRFATIEGFDHVVIENCSLEGTAGIYLLDYAGDRSTANTVRIVANRSRNIDGRRSDGNGGYLADAALVQFVQLDKVRGVSGAEIAWNDVVNAPDQSRVEDVISIYLSGGAKGSPVRIHDNFIRGAYPFPAATASYAGGGIMLADGVAKDGPGGDPAFVHAYDNHVLDTVNHGIAISAGHDCQVDRNRVISKGLMPDGKTKIAAQNVGIYVWDSYKAGPQRFYANSGRENVVGWVNNKDGRNDWWRPDASAWDANQHWPEPIGADVYEQERRRWEEKVKAAGVTVGPATKPAA